MGFVNSHIKSIIIDLLNQFSTNLGWWRKWLTTDHWTSFLLYKMTHFFLWSFLWLLWSFLVVCLRVFMFDLCFGFILGFVVVMFVLSFRGAGALFRYSAAHFRYKSARVSMFQYESASSRTSQYALLHYESVYFSTSRYVSDRFSTLQVSTVQRVSGKLSTFQWNTNIAQPSML